MIRPRNDFTDDEEALLGIERPSIEDEEEAERRHQEDLQLRKDYLAHLMSQDMFREWLFAKLQAFNTFGMPFGVSPGGFPDPLATHFALGMKAAGWALWEEFDNLVPELTSLMRRKGSQPRS